MHQLKVLEGGVGYTAGNTTMTIQFPGSGVQFNAVLQSWRINLVQKYINNFADDDGFITLGLNREHELQYTHLYAPRKLREAMFGRDASGKILYGKSDLRRVASVKLNLQIIHQLLDMLMMEIQLCHMDLLNKLVVLLN
ncbi:MAG: hypothetical protein CM15mV12_0150 [uncultured marine virus]|nr:MAG: hypothetical protein CM15mV12_0150 [uncultured marine virus]